MKRVLGSLVALGLMVVASCSPDEPTATGACSSVTDCPLDQICDRATKSCIPEPTNRLVGKFDCHVLTLADVPTNADLSEVIARIGSRRFTLPNVSCAYDEENQRFHVTFFRPELDAVAFLSVFSVIDLGTPGELGPDVSGGDNAVSVSNPHQNVRYGSSLSGSIVLGSNDIISVGLEVHGYVDVTMAPAATEAVRFGAACPNGIADCGFATAAAGGANACSAKSQTCVRSCKASGECSAGQGVCNLGLCTNPCQTDADCVAPLTCTAPNTAGEGRGCSAR